VSLRDANLDRVSIHRELVTVGNSAGGNTANERWSRINKDTFIVKDTKIYTIL
jgi:hypothetical protein